MSVLLLIISLGLILLAAEGFTNGVEAVGRKFSLTQAVVGSILAAVGTALPETILPIVAIFFGTSHGVGKEIGVGAILGAPFMLSTVAFFLVGLSVAITAIRKLRKFKLNIEFESTRRDLLFFIVMYSLAIFVPMIAGRALAAPMALFLLAGYAFYVYLTARGESAEIEHMAGLHLHSYFQKFDIFKGNSPSLALIILQIVLTLAIMVSGAHLFVKNLEVISLRLGMSPLLFALILAPIATELPEKFNSVTWTLKGKDSLALGNITGAMVFQSTFPVSVGLLFTEWHITGTALLSAILSLLSAIILLSELLLHKRISPVTLLLGGFFYLFYIGTVIVHIVR